MKRTLYVLSFLALFAGSVFGQNPKFDKKLNDKVTKGNAAEKVRVIIQRRTPASPSEKGDITNGGGKIRREFKLLKSQVADVPVSLLPKLAGNPSIIHISIDEPVKAHAGEPYTVSGAQLANQHYGVTGNGIGVAVVDSGIASHPDLTVAKAVDFVDASHTGGYDPFGHGT